MASSSMSTEPELSTAASSSGAASLSLSALAQRCKEALQDLNDLSETELSEHDEKAATAHNVKGRFNVWGMNLGAFRHVSSRSSLDWRLRKASLMEGAVRATLMELNDAGGRARSILATEIPNRGADDLASLLEGIDRNDPNNHELIKFLSSPTTELDELFCGIKSSIDRLFNLAMLIRRDARDRKQNQLPLATFSPGDNPSLDNHITHLKDKFPKLVQQPWLQQRLSQAFLQRREFILGRHSRQHQLESVDIGGGAVSGKQPSVVATTYEDISVDLEKQERWARHSVQSGATSFATAFSEGDDGELGVPDLTQFVFHGVRLKYNEVFECPLCRDFDSVGSKHEWKRHVFSDLRPYVCTFEKCSSRLFSTRHEWFGHELEFHRRLWYCNRCDANSPSEEPLMDHFVEIHPEIAHSRLSKIPKTRTRPTTDFPAGSCPFCDNWKPSNRSDDNGMEFCEHLGRHFQQLALDAIPLTIEGLEILPSEDVKPDPTENDIDKEPEEDARPQQEGEAPTQTSSYWSVSEGDDFPYLLASFGSDWAAIAGYMGSKTAVMVKNYFVRNKDQGKTEWEAIVQEADGKRSRGEPLPDPPQPDPHRTVPIIIAVQKQPGTDWVRVRGKSDMSLEPPMP